MTFATDVQRASAALVQATIQLQNTGAAATTAAVSIEILNPEHRCLRCVWNSSAILNHA